MADAKGRSDECVARLMIEDILVHLQLLSGEKNAKGKILQTECVLASVTLTQCMLRWVCLLLSV